MSKLRASLSELEVDRRVITHMDRATHELQMALSVVSSFRKKARGGELRKVREIERTLARAVSLLDGNARIGGRGGLNDPDLTPESERPLPDWVLQRRSKDRSKDRGNS